MDKKLSFSISSKSAGSKANRNPKKTSHSLTDNDGIRNEDNSAHRFITEFGSNDRTLDSNQDPTKPQKLMIAPIENEYRPGKRMKNLDLPLCSSAHSGGDIDFEDDSSMDVGNEGAGGNLSYGLNIGRFKKDGASYEEDGQGKESIANVLLKKLKDDINRLPADDESFNQFEEVPVEDLGAALMAGYGWNVDGNSHKKDVGSLHNGSSGFSVGREVRIIGGRDMMVSLCWRS